MQLGEIGMTRVEKEHVKINGVEYLSYFDSASSVNIISDRILKEIGYTNITWLEKPFNCVLLIDKQLVFTEKLYLQLITKEIQ